MCPETENSRVPGLFGVPTALKASAPLRDDPGDVGQRLDVVHDGRLLVEPPHGEARRAVARIALLAFQRREQARSLAGHVGTGAPIDHDVAGKAGAEDVLAEQPGRVGFFDGAGEPAVGQVEFAADVDEAVAHVAARSS